MILVWFILFNKFGGIGIIFCIVLVFVLGIVCLGISYIRYLGFIFYIDYLWFFIYLDCIGFIFRLLSSFFFILYTDYRFTVRF